MEIKGGEEGADCRRGGKRGVGGKAGKEKFKKTQKNNCTDTASIDATSVSTWAVNVSLPLTTSSLRDASPFFT